MNGFPRACILCGHILPPDGVCWKCIADARVKLEDEKWDRREREAAEQGKREMEAS